jgi:hypothetical protein
MGTVTVTHWLGTDGRIAFRFLCEAALKTLHEHLYSD